MAVRATLTEKEQQRARTLAAILKDAGINAIYTNPRLRSIQTAEPLAKALNVESKTLPVRLDDIEGLIRALRTHPRDRVLDGGSAKAGGSGRSTP